MTENEKPGMPDRVSVDRYCVGTEAEQWGVSNIGPTENGKWNGLTDRTEYVRADLYEAMRENAVRLARALKENAQHRDPYCWCPDRQCHDESVNCMDECLWGRKALAAHDAMMKE